MSKEEELKKEIDKRVMRGKRICFCCGKGENITLHHLRDFDMLLKKKRYKGDFKGYILLCRDCHDIVEMIQLQKKGKKEFYRKGFQEGKAEAKQDEIKFLEFGFISDWKCHQCCHNKFLIDKRLQELKG